MIREMIQKIRGIFDDPDPIEVGDLVRVRAKSAYYAYDAWVKHNVENPFLAAKSVTCRTICRSLRKGDTGVVRCIAPHGSAGHEDEVIAYVEILGVGYPIEIKNLEKVEG
jgi:hypothetical protein